MTLHWRAGRGQSFDGTTVYGSVAAVTDVRGNVSISLGSRPQPLYRLTTHAPAPRAFSVEEARKQPSLLLNAQHEQVEFVGRRHVLDTLGSWRGDAARASVLLLHGPGGQGKSRLAARFTRESVEAGWTVLQVRPGTAPVGGTGDGPGSAGGVRAAAGEEGLLLVVDYAEQWRSADLLAFLADSAEQDTGRVRVLLVARPANRWWFDVTTRIRRIDIVGEQLRLEPLTGEVPRDKLFTGARELFARALDVSGTEGTAVPGYLAGPDFSSVLAVHMAALTEVDSLRLGLTAPGSAAEISAYLLGREYENWAELHRGQQVAVGPAVMAQAVYTATLTKPLPYQEGLRALRNVGIESDRHPGEIIKDHALPYPPEKPETVLEPLYPDRLGEDFLALLLATDGEELLPTDPWALEAPARLLTLAGDGSSSASWIRNVLNTLIETAQRWPHVATRQLVPLLVHHPELVHTAGAAALSRLARIGSLPIGVLDAFEAGLPWTDPELDAGAAVLAAFLAPMRLRSARDDAARARVHDALSERLNHAGLYKEALAEAKTALQLHRTLAAQNAEHLPALARCLDGVGILYDFNELYDEALRCSREAVQLFRELVRRDPAHRRRLGYALANIAAREHDPAARRAWAQEAVDIGREMAGDDPTREGVELAGALQNLGNALAEMGRHEEALEVLREAVDIRVRQVARNPGPYQEHLSTALVALAAALARQGNEAEALRLFDEHIAMFQRLARANPARFSASLAGVEVLRDRLSTRPS
ncbi:tetratricopeptide repeat protein [Streptomyces sp. NPDC051219]|uniref:tetratricopeptide repeat protein n=1 Tax=Streptomyces sp. NPDC051219 TaxID=3155283 RepID=UPI00341588E0